MSVEQIKIEDQVAVKVEHAPGNENLPEQPAPEPQPQPEVPTKEVASPTNQVDAPPPEAPKLPEVVRVAVTLDISGRLDAVIKLAAKKNNLPVEKIMSDLLADGAQMHLFKGCNFCLPEKIAAAREAQARFERARRAAETTRNQRKRRRKLERQRRKENRG